MGKKKRQNKPKMKPPQMHSAHEPAKQKNFVEVTTRLEKAFEKARLDAGLFLPGSPTEHKLLLKQALMRLNAASILVAENS